MKHILFLISFIFLSQTVTAQTFGLSKGTYKYVLNKEFANLIKVDGYNGIGTYASVDIADAKVDFSGYNMFDNGHIIQLKAGGGINEGVTSIFSGQELSSNFNFTASYSFLLFNKNTKIKYKAVDYNSYKNDSLKLENKKTLLYINYKNKKDSLDLAYKRLKLSSDSSKISKQLTVEQNKRNKDQFKIDSLNLALITIQADIKIVDNLLIEEYTNRSLIYNDKDNKMNKKIVGLRDSIPLTGIRVSWISIGYNNSTNFFKHFTDSLTYADQINKSQFMNHSIGVQYNLYSTIKKDKKKKNKKPLVKKPVYFYMDIGFELGISDNFSSLSERAVKEVRTYNDGTTQRTVTKEYKVYEGEYLKNLKSFRVFFDYYLFLTKTQKVAVHFFPSHLIKDGEYPLSNIGIGFNMFYKDKEDSKNKVNSELFVNLTDIFDNNNIGRNVFQRSSYGIRFTFPLKM